MIELSDMVLHCIHGFGQGYEIHHNFADTFVRRFQKEIASKIRQRRAPVSTEELARFFEKDYHTVYPARGDKLVRYSVLPSVFFDSAERQLSIAHDKLLPTYRAIRPKVMPDLLMGPQTRIVKGFDEDPVGYLVSKGMSKGNAIAALRQMYDVLHALESGIRHGVQSRIESNGAQLNSKYADYHMRAKRGSRHVPAEEIKSDAADAWNPVNPFMWTLGENYGEKA